MFMARTVSEAIGVLHDVALDDGDLEIKINIDGISLSVMDMTDNGVIHASLKDLDNQTKYQALMPDIWCHVSTLAIVQELKRRYPTELKLSLGVLTMLRLDREINGVSLEEQK